MLAYRVLLLFAAAIAGAQQTKKPSTGVESPFVSIPPFVRDTLRFEARIPDFEAKDITGRPWNSAELLGKFTVIDVWSTLPVRNGVDNRGAYPKFPPVGSEHPELQRFYERTKASKNIQVLTFCTDYDYTHARVYMAEKHYSFPVIADWKVTDKIFGDAGDLPALLQWPGWQEGFVAKF